MILTCGKLQSSRQNIKNLIVFSLYHILSLFVLKMVGSVFMIALFPFVGALAIPQTPSTAVSSPSGLTSPPIVETHPLESVSASEPNVSPGPNQVNSTEIPVSVVGDEESTHENDTPNTSGVPTPASSRPGFVNIRPGFVRHDDMNKGHILSGNDIGTTGTSTGAQVL